MALSVNNYNNLAKSVKTIVIKNLKGVSKTKRKPIKPIVDSEKPISKVYPVIDTDLARDNIENDIPEADLQDL